MVNLFDFLNLDLATSARLRHWSAQERSQTSSKPTGYVYLDYVEANTFFMCQNKHRPRRRLTGLDLSEFTEQAKCGSFLGVSAPIFETKNCKYAFCIFMFLTFLYQILQDSTI